MFPNRHVIKKILFSRCVKKGRGNTNPSEWKTHLTQAHTPPPSYKPLHHLLSMRHPHVQHAIFWATHTYCLKISSTLFIITRIIQQDERRTENMNANSKYSTHCNEFFWENWTLFRKIQIIKLFLNLEQLIYAHFSFSSLSAAGGSSGWEMWNSVQRFLQLPASTGREHGQLSTGTGREGKPPDHLHVRGTDEIYVCASREGEKRREEPDGRS